SSGYSSRPVGGTSYSSPASSAGGRHTVKVTSGLDIARQAAQASAGSGGNGTVSYAAGDKVTHNKWGEGTVISVKGRDNDEELQIAFPAPIGIKKLLAKFAPIKKV